MMQKLKTELEPILSKKEIEVVIKRLNNKHLTQTESNYMSRSIRPKLKAARFAANSDILSLLDYRRKKYEREHNILNEEIICAVKKHAKRIRAIAIFGSYVRNHHTAYRDIDILVVLDKALWKKIWERDALKKKIEADCNMQVDVQLTEYSSLKRMFPYSPLLQTELENQDVIYGSLDLKKKIIPNKRHLYIDLLEIEIFLELAKSIEPKYIYNAIRMCLSIELFLQKQVNNAMIIETIEQNIGKTTADSLRNNTANKMQKEIAVRYLKHLYKMLEKILK